MGPPASRQGGGSLLRKARGGGFDNAPGFQYIKWAPMAEKKILIVDYDTQSLEALTRLIASQKIQVITAPDGQMGYEKFQSEKPDLVILEAILPKIHGFDLTKKIIQESGGQVPVVIVTGLYKGPHYRHEAIASFGASDYFEKPVDPERFVDTIRGLMHEEDDIDEALPDSNDVIESLAQRLRDHSLQRNGASDPGKDKSG
jgi:DNA-binding response OmpR family regulator